MPRMLFNHALGTVCTMIRPHSASVLRILKVVCPACFAFQTCVQIAPQSCFCHLPHCARGFRALYYFADHCECGVPIRFCFRCCDFLCLRDFHFRACRPPMLQGYPVRLNHLQRTILSLQLLRSVLFESMASSDQMTLSLTSIKVSKCLQFGSFTSHLQAFNGFKNHQMLVK